MTYFLCTLIVLVMSAIVFTLLNKYFNAAAAITYISTAISFILVMISFIISHNGKPLSMILRILYNPLPNQPLLSILVIICYLSRAIIVFMRKMGVDLITGLYGLMMMVVLVALPKWAVALATLIFSGYQ